MESAASRVTVAAVQPAQPARAVWLGRVLFGCSVAMLAVALALDLHAGKYGTILYVGVGVGLACLGSC